MDTILKTLLYEWRDRTLPSFIKRNQHIDTSLQEGTNNATVVTGFRRVGKTYLVYEAIEELLKTNSKEDVVYINFENEKIINPTTDLLTNLIPQCQEVFGKKPKYLFLDELQLIPNWSKWVRRILDTEAIQLFITGSSSKMSSSELPTELRGRSWEVKVKPLTFEEFLRFKKIPLDLEKIQYVKDDEAKIRFQYEHYLLFGGLPAVVLTSQEKKQELLQSYFDTVVGKDISERNKIENDLALRTLLKLLLNSNHITISKLHNTFKSMAIPVGKSTIDNYISYIKTSYFMNELHIYNRSVVNQLQYPRKVYFVDTGFITALSTKFSKNMGRLFENAVYNKLSLQNELMYYYKDENGNEVDFAVLEEGKTKALYQVCFDLNDEDTQKREIRSLIKAGEQLSCNNLNLLTLDYPKQLEIPESIKIVSVPEIYTS